ncbi:MAG: helix-hairpin-helix domain-containing protein [Candidatus Omnitrophota bacterium]|nr:helix-hairpin-helix domain-containing protein [Candidatus Omnitrophota bacterium]
MIGLTRQERAVLLVFGAVIFCGTGLDWVFKMFPKAGEAVHFIDAQSMDGRVDINSASAEQLEKLPRVGRVLAQRIAAYRKEHGPFREIGELRNVEGIGPKSFERIAPFVRPVNFSQD